jgi:aspartyl protease family protein
MKNRFVIIALISGVILLLLRGYLGPISWDNDKLPNVVYMTIILSAAIIGITNSKMPFQQVVKYAGAWVLIIGALLVTYSYRNNLKEIFNHVYANIVPGAVIKGADENTLSIIANQSGHFFVNATVNGVDMKFMIDTGATNVALTRNDARSLGIDLDSLSYANKVSTANGVVWFASVTLDHIQIGNIKIQNVNAAVGRDDGLDTSLLGMSFLNKLKSYQVQNDTLTMTEK